MEELSPIGSGRYTLPKHLFEYVNVILTWGTSSRRTSTCVSALATARWSCWIGSSLTSLAVTLVGSEASTIELSESVGVCNYCNTGGYVLIDWIPADGLGSLSGCICAAK